MNVWTEHEAREYAAHFAAKYPLKKDRQAVVKAILNAAEMNVPLEGREFNCAFATLAGHADLSEKIGVGLVAIEVRAALYGTRCFYIARLDGSGTDFSYLKCLQNPTPKADVRNAARAAVRADLNLKKVYRLALPGGAVCDVTGMPITAENSHVHHAPPMFDVLVDGWVETVGGYEAIAANLLNGDNVHGNYFCEMDAASWLTWHTHRANLLLVHRDANLLIEAARRKIKAAV